MSRRSISCRNNFNSSLWFLGHGISLLSSTALSGPWRLPDGHPSAGSCQTLSVRAEGQPIERLPAVLQRQYFLAIRHVPDLDDRTVGRGQTPAVGAEAHGLEKVGVALQGINDLAGFRIPDDRRFVIARGGQTPTVRR